MNKNNTAIWLTSVLVMLTSISVSAKPRIRTSHDINDENLARIKVHNETPEALLCYVAINGHKIRFRLSPQGQSIWYKATDVRFNYTDFHTWCDYLKNYPQYQKNN